MGTSIAGSWKTRIQNPQLPRYIYLPIPYLNLNIEYRLVFSALESEQKYSGQT